MSPWRRLSAARLWIDVGLWALAYLPHLPIALIGDSPARRWPRRRTSVPRMRDRYAAADFGPPSSDVQPAPAEQRAWYAWEVCGRRYAALARSQRGRRRGRGRSRAPARAARSPGAVAGRGSSRAREEPGAVAVAGRGSRARERRAGGAVAGAGGAGRRRGTAPGRQDGRRNRNGAPGNEPRGAAGPGPSTGTGARGTWASARGRRRRPSRGCRRSPVARSAPG